MSKAELIARMTNHLEDACDCLTAGDRSMFHYHAGRADAISEILDDLFIWDDEYRDDEYRDEHIQNMLDIIEKNW